MNCPLCNNTQTTLLRSCVRFNLEAEVKKCQSCSHVYLDTDTFELPENFYQSEYHQTYLTHIDPDALEPVTYFNKMSSVTKPWADRIKALLKGDETLLDVGCSTGHLLDQLRGSAKQLMGQDLNEKEVAFCKNNLELDVRTELPHTWVEPESCDVITLIFVLEHIAKSVDFLKNLTTLLKPGGMIIAVVPNADDPLLTLYDAPAFSDFYYCIEHLHYFTPASMQHVFEAAGLTPEISAIQEYPLANHLHWLTQQKPREAKSARNIVPEFPFTTASQQEKIWTQTNQCYANALEQSGMTDRVLAIAKK